MGVRGKINQKLLPTVLAVGISLSLIGLGWAGDPSASHEIIVVPNLAYRDGPSKRWRLDLAWKKSNALGKPRPAIVVIHGGGWLEGDKSSFASRKYGVPGNIEEFADLGFVAVTINYRLSGEAPFPAALEDCQCAVRWLRAHAKEYNIDPDHIGAYGNSAGGHLALLLGSATKDVKTATDRPYAEQSSGVQAVASDSGPIDLLFQYDKNSLKQVVSKFLGGPPDMDRVASYKSASPMYQIHPEMPPILLIYGVSDDQVPIVTADRYVLALQEVGLKDVSYHRLAYVDHCPHSLVRLPELKQVVNEFFQRTLMHPETAQQIRRRIKSP
jgi:acetyl esterase/lipase